MNDKNGSGNSNKNEWVARMLQTHLKDNQLNASMAQKIQLLKKRKKSRWWMLVLNILAILLFGYSFYAGITQLSEIVLYILIAVFIINLGFIYHQTKQLKQLITYLQNPQDHSEEV